MLLIITKCSNLRRPSHTKYRCIFIPCLRNEEESHFFFNPMPHMSLTDFVVFPPGDGRSVTDFSGWDANEARLRCPDDVSGDIGGCSARRALKPNFN